MIRELVLSGIKAFKLETPVRLGQCTVIVGRNSSGKSTIFQALLLLKQAFERPPRSFSGMALNGDYVSVGTYEDWSADRLSAPSTIRVSIGALKVGTELQTLWWRNGRNRAEATASASFTFAPSEDEPTAAQLTSLRYSSETNEKTRSRKWSLTAAPRPRPPSGLWVFVEDDPDIGYSLAATFEHTTDRGPDRISASGVAAIDGLGFSSILQELEYEAARRTLARAIRISIEAILAYLAGGATTPTSQRDPNPTDAIEDLANADLTTLASYWDSVPDLRSAVARGAVTEDWGPASIAFLSSIERVLNERELFATSERGVAEVLKPLAIAYPELKRALRLVEINAGLATARPEPTEAVDARELLNRAAREYREQRHTYRTVRRSQDILEVSRPQRASFVEVRDLRELFVPSEVDFQGFFEKSVFHLGPLRDEPRSLYSSNLPNDAADVGRNGQRAVECLRRFGREKVVVVLPNRANPTMTTLMEATQAWCKHIGITESLTVSQESKYGTICRVTTPGGNRSVADMTNVGVGVSQLLPVVVLCMAAPAGATILVEQPELHLHPSAQVALASLFNACIVGGRQVVIETHSEHLINGLRLAIANKKMSHDDLSILFLSRDEFGSEVSKVEVGADGSIARWPRGFFDEAEQLLLKILDTRMGTHGNPD
ncbi:MAG: DUF3696 domain-containing protein [Myxococcaceae bacterium]